MKRKILSRCLLGAPIGFTISTMITIIISITIGDGNYYPIVPQLAIDCSSELNAVVLQALFSFLYGAAWGGASMIWEIEHWSLSRQSLTHLAVCSIFTFPIAYLMRWMDHSVSGILLYFGIFAFMYTFIWVAQYISIRKKIRQLNEKMQENDKTN